MDGGAGALVRNDEEDHGFVYSQAGGLPPPLHDGGCLGQEQTITFTLPRTVTSEGCQGGFDESWSVQLSDAQVSELRQKLRALRTTTKAECGADAPNETLIVSDRAGLMHAYYTNFYAGCGYYDAGAQMLIDFQSPEGREFEIFLFGLQPRADGG